MSVVMSSACDAALRRRLQAAGYPDANAFNADGNYSSSYYSINRRSIINMPDSRSLISNLQLQLLQTRPW